MEWQKNSKTEIVSFCYIHEAEDEGFKPPIPKKGIPDFESSAFGHSANLPNLPCKSKHNSAISKILDHLILLGTIQRQCAAMFVWIRINVLQHHLKNLLSFVLVFLPHDNNKVFLLVKIFGYFQKIFYNTPCIAAIFSTTFLLRSKYWNYEHFS